MDVAHLAAATEPFLAHIVEAHAVEVFEVVEREDVVSLFTELAVEPREARTAEASQVDVVVPQFPVVALVSHIVIGHGLQGLLDALVGRMDDAGQETVFVLHPCGVGLEPCHLLRHHLDAGICSFEYAFAHFHLRGFDGVDTVGAVGDEVEQVEIDQVLTVGEARVAQRHFQSGVTGSESALAVEVGEIHHSQVLIAHECLTVYGIELVVVPFTDVVAEFECPLMFVDELVVGTDHLGVLDAMTAHLVLTKDGVVLVGKGILSSIFLQLGHRHGFLIGEVLFERFPRFALEEVVLAGGVDDDMELRWV